MDTFDLEIYQGQTFSATLILRDDAGTPMDLSGYEISGYLKTRYGNSGILTNLNVNIVTPTSGLVSLGIPATGTALLPVNYAFYDIEMRNPNDDVVTKVLAGKASIYPEVTY